VVIVVVRNLADPGSGDASAYFDAYTFFVLPHGLLAMSIATTFVPEMARAVARRDRDAFTARASLGVRLIGLLTVPAGILLFVLRRAIVGAFLQHGEYTSAAADNTSRALAGFALGLIGFSIYLFVLRGFYAHQDTRTPFIINLFECALNIVLAFVLVGRYGILGLGLAFAISYVVGALWALQVLSYKVPTFPLGSVFRGLLPMVVAGVLAGEVMWLVAVNVGGNSGGEAVLRLAVAGLVGLVAYVAVLFILRVPEVTGIVDRIRAVRPSPSET
jgi:putative peptidoglycan lipid II flippase